MKKLMLTVMVVMLAGCACMQQYVPATSGRVQNLETKVAEIDGYTKGLNIRVTGLETGLENTNTRLDRTDAQVSRLNTKVNHRYADLTAYTNVRVEKIRKIVAAREARSIYASNASEIQPCFLGPFSSGSSLVSPKLEKQLKKLIGSLKKRHLQVMEIDGFASSNTGSVARNAELSKFRALAIADWLRARKIKVNKVCGLGGVACFGEPRDNRSVVVFAQKAPILTTPQTPASKIKTP